MACCTSPYLRRLHTWLNVHLYEGYWDRELSAKEYSQLKTNGCSRSFPPFALSVVGHKDHRASPPAELRPSVHKLRMEKICRNLAPVFSVGCLQDGFRKSYRLSTTRGTFISGVRLLLISRFSVPLKNSKTRDLFGMEKSRRSGHALHILMRTVSFSKAAGPWCG